uniref:Cytidine deaminase n=1 Tax=Homalodisca liturata TaxID=320908 RepID=A0A1B6I3G4_9HEMI
MVEDIITDERLEELSALGHEVQELVRASCKARDHAYCPYSQFSVGAAVRMSSGDLYTGCNIENSAYPVTICAERTAIAKAVSEGNKNISAIAVTAILEPNKTFVFPCGSCRQFIVEFAKDKDVPIYLAKPDLKNIYVTSIKKLLPHDFHF